MVVGESRCPLAKRGPRPTPKAILKLRGSRRDGYLPDQPEAAPGTPVKPDYLEKDASAMWDQLVPQLLKLGVLSNIDGVILAELCEAWADLRACKRFVKKHGRTYKVTKIQFGKVVTEGSKLWPQTREIAHLRTFILRSCAEFGLSPSSRTRLSVEGKPDINELDKLLNSKIG